MAETNSKRRLSLGHRRDQSDTPPPSPHYTVTSMLRPPPSSIALNANGSRTSVATDNDVSDSSCRTDEVRHRRRSLGSALPPLSRLTHASPLRPLSKHAASGSSGVYTHASNSTISLSSYQYHYSRPQRSGRHITSPSHHDLTFNGQSPSKVPPRATRLPVPVMPKPLHRAPSASSSLYSQPSFRIERKGSIVERKPAPVVTEEDLLTPGIPPVANNAVQPVSLEAEPSEQMLVGKGKQARGTPALKKEPSNDAWPPRGWEAYVSAMGSPPRTRVNSVGPQSTCDDGHESHCDQKESGPPEAPIGDFIFDQETLTFIPPPKSTLNVGGKKQKAEGKRNSILSIFPTSKHTTVPVINANSKTGSQVDQTQSSLPPPIPQRSPTRATHNPSDSNSPNPGPGPAVLKRRARPKSEHGNDQSIPTQHNRSQSAHEPVRSDKPGIFQPESTSTTDIHRTSTITSHSAKSSLTLKPSVSSSKSRKSSFSSKLRWGWRKRAKSVSDTQNDPPPLPNSGIPMIPTTTATLKQEQDPIDENLPPVIPSVPPISPTKQAHPPSRSSGSFQVLSRPPRSPPEPPIPVLSGRIQDQGSRADVSASSCAIALNSNTQEQPTQILFKESFSSSYTDHSRTSTHAMADDGGPIAVVLVEPEPGFETPPYPRASIDICDSPSPRSQLQSWDRPTSHVYTHNYTYSSPSPCISYSSPSAPPGPGRWSSRTSIDVYSNPGTNVTVDVYSNPVEVYSSRSSNYHSSTPALNAGYDYQMNENEARRQWASVDGHSGPKEGYAASNDTARSRKRWTSVDGHSRSNEGYSASHDGHSSARSHGHGSTYDYGKPRAPFSHERGKRSGGSGSDSSRSSVLQTPSYASSCDSFKPSAMDLRLSHLGSGSSTPTSPLSDPAMTSVPVPIRKGILAAAPQTRRNGHSGRASWLATWGTSSDSSADANGATTAPSSVNDDNSPLATFSPPRAKSTPGTNAVSKASPLRPINASRTTLDTTASHGTTSTVAPTRRPSAKLKKKRKAPLIFDMVTPSHLVKS